MRSPKREYLTLSRHLKEWAADETCSDIANLDAALEWLKDNDCLNGKGELIAYAYWFKYMYKNKKAYTKK